MDGYGGGRGLLALFNACSAVNIFIVCVRVGFGQRGTSHSGSPLLRDAHWCECKKQLRFFYYGSQLISSSVASALCGACWSLTARFEHDSNPTYLAAYSTLQTQSPNSLTCQSIWTQVSLSHQVRLPCVLMTPLLPEKVSFPLSRFITSFQVISDVLTKEPSVIFECNKQREIQP